MDKWDYTQELIAFVIDSHPSLQSAMRHAAERLSPHISQSTLDLIGKTDFGLYEARITSHLQRLLINEPPPNNIQAFYLGLFDQRGGVLTKYEHQTMYICGTNRFAIDDDGDWACDPLWFPNGKYFSMPILKLFGKHEPVKGLNTGFPLSQTFSAACAIAIAPQLAASIQERYHPVPIATGHDAGGIFVVGYATQDGIEKP